MLSHRSKKMTVKINDRTKGIFCKNVLSFQFVAVVPGQSPVSPFLNLAKYANAPFYITDSDVPLCLQWRY